MLSVAGAAALGSALLVAVEKYWGKDPFIRAAILLAIVGCGLNLWQAYPYPETAPIGLILMVVVPVLLAAIVIYAMRKSAWYLRWAYATLLAFIGVFPSYLMGCIVSEWLPVPGCFF